MPPFLENFIYDLTSCTKPNYSWKKENDKKVLLHKLKANLIGTELLNKSITFQLDTR